MNGLDSADIFQFETFLFDRAGGCLFRVDGAGDAGPVTLGSRALALLAVLIERQGQLVSKDEIFAAVWPGTAVEEANLTVQISALRRVLDRDRKQGSCIQTIPGRGYRFVPPVTRAEALTATSISTPGNGSGGPLAAKAQLEPPSAMRTIDALPPGRRPSAPQRPRRAVIATVAGALCLAAVVVAAVNWHLFSPREDRSAPRLSIVVLPFANLSNDPDRQYFADALTEDLTIDMSRLVHMFVISSSTAFKFRGKPIDIKQVGRELGVRYVLEGSVQRSANRVRVNVQLIDAGTGADLWVDRFDRNWTDLFALRDEITGRIAWHLNAEVAIAEAKRPAEPPDALDYILRGRAEWHRWPPRNNYAQAIHLFEQALALNPQSVEAQTLLADVLATRVLRQQTDTPAADLARAEGLVEQALDLSPRNGLAHYDKGQVLRAQQRFEEAIPEYEAAIVLYPNLAGAYGNLGWCKFMIGSLDEVIPLQERATRIGPEDPFLGTLYVRIGLVELVQSHLAEAIIAFKKARAARTADIVDVHAYLAAAYALNGETEQAATELTEVRRMSHDDRFSSISQVKAGLLKEYPREEIRALFEATYVAGLRKAGMPEE